MSRSRSRRAELPPPQDALQKLQKMVEDGACYEAQQVYKTTAARYLAAQRYSEVLDILESGALIQLKHSQVTCGSELAVLFVETLVKSQCPYGKEIIDRISRIYLAFPKISLPVDLEEDPDVQKLAEAMAAAKVRVESCSSFLKSALKWSVEFGDCRYGSPELHDMLAEYIYSESPEVDMAKVSSHFVHGKNPKKFADTLVNFMGKCYPGEDDVAIARAILMYLSEGNLRDANYLINEIKKELQSKDDGFPESDLIQFVEYLLQTLERDALPLFNILRQKYNSSINRESLFNELLDSIAEKFYGVRRRSNIQDLLGDMFKFM